MIFNEDFKLKLYHIFFPNKCLLCNDITNYNKIICDSCKKDTSIRVGINNKKTAKLYDFYAPYFYTDSARIALLDFKFNQNLSKGDKFACVMALLIINNKMITNVDLITFVPKYYKDKNKFNTSYELANQISKITNIQLSCDILVKIKKTQKQHDLNKEERSKNLNNAFICPKPNLLNNKTILIIDDVMTTGNTLNIPHYSKLQNALF